MDCFSAARRQAQGDAERGNQGTRDVAQRPRWLPWRWGEETDSRCARSSELRGFAEGLKVEVSP